MTTTTRENRVLSVLSDESPMRQVDVIAAARMDGSTCAATLMLLERLKLVTCEVSRTGKQGRPAYLYRRVRTEAA